MGGGLGAFAFSVGGIALGFVDAFRTLCLAPNPDIPIFLRSQSLGCS